MGELQKIGQSVVVCIDQLSCCCTCHQQLLSCDCNIQTAMITSLALMIPTAVCMLQLQESHVLAITFLKLMVD